MSTPAILALEDGSIFKGISIGAEGLSVAEVVFNTAVIGYQEALTNPSNAQKLIALTYPHIGNYGINAEDDESGKVQASGLIIRDLSFVASNFRSEKALDVYLKEQGVVAIAKIDTRRLTRILRNQGFLKGCILAGKDAYSEANQAKAIAAAQAFTGNTGQDLVKTVTTDEAYEWNQTSWQLGQGFGELNEAKHKVVVYDLGVKRSLLRALASKGCALTVVPAGTSAKDVLALNPDGVFFSNGPGDISVCSSSIEAAKGIIEASLPVFGLSLGMQLIGVAAGGKVIKLKISEQGANHPVQDVNTKKVRITSQDQSFALDAASLPASVKVTRNSLFDGSVQGIELNDKPVFGLQGYVERYPGPNGIVEMFDRFVDLLAVNK